MTFFKMKPFGVAQYMGTFVMTSVNYTIGPIKSAEEGGCDEDIQLGEKKLLRLSDSSGKLEMTEVAKGDDIRRDMLDNSDVFVLGMLFSLFPWKKQKTKTPS